MLALSSHSFYHKWPFDVLLDNPVPFPMSIRIKVGTRLYDKTTYWLETRLNFLYKKCIECHFEPNRNGLTRQNFNKVWSLYKKIHEESRGHSVFMKFGSFYENFKLSFHICRFLMEDCVLEVFQYLIKKRY